MKFGGIFVVLLLSLGACSSDPQPREPQTTSRPAPTPTSTATLPPMPEQAREDSPEGAAAFVDHWVDVFNYAAATGDVAELSQLSSPSCTGCQDYIALYKKTYEDGGYFRGGDWKLSDVEIETLTEMQKVFVHIDAARGQQRADSKSAAGPTTGEDTDLVFSVVLADTNPRVVKIERPN